MSLAKVTASCGVAQNWSLKGFDTNKQTNLNVSKNWDKLIDVFIDIWLGPLNK